MGHRGRAVEGRRGTYVLESPLGDGMFGDVWSASVQPAAASVAVKLLRGHASEGRRAEASHLS